jgi:hypothetical protein
MVSSALHQFLNFSFLSLSIELLKQVFRDMGVNQRHLKPSFPLRQFLQQLFFSPLPTVVWNPTRFWCTYKIQFLEHCWDINLAANNHYINLLERCWLMELTSAKEEKPSQDTQEM